MDNPADSTINQENKFENIEQINNTTANPENIERAEELLRQMNDGEIPKNPWDDVEVPENPWSDDSILASDDDTLFSVFNPDDPADNEEPTQTEEDQLYEDQQALGQLYNPAAQNNEVDQNEINVLAVAVAADLTQEKSKNSEEAQANKSNDYGSLNPLINPDGSASPMNTGTPKESSPKESNQEYANAVANTINNPEIYKAAAAIAIANREKDAEQISDNELQRKIANDALETLDEGEHNKKAEIVSNIANNLESTDGEDILKYDAEKHGILADGPNDTKIGQDGEVFNNGRLVGYIQNNEISFLNINDPEDAENIRDAKLKLGLIEEGEIEKSAHIENDTQKLEQDPLDPNNTSPENRDKKEELGQSQAEKKSETPDDCFDKLPSEVADSPIVKALREQYGQAGNAEVDVDALYEALARDFTSDTPASSTEDKNHQIIELSNNLMNIIPAESRMPSDTLNTQESSNAAEENDLKALLAAITAVSEGIAAKSLSKLGDKESSSLRADNAKMLSQMAENNKDATQNTGEEDKDQELGSTSTTLRLASLMSEGAKKYAEKLQQENKEN